ncbi:hypothetical protein BAE44_0011077 [Dichanthelium oligosanthes]|uniref:RING-type domain-containing protein n=1 Tax=Dichanthelium oligosanthes TaxID=888268 RepID=A0A1E5VS09_9POAL|nr:hypothetical protein BAE44_0011077 [Dichanthelium oligosanthes]
MATNKTSSSRCDACGGNLGRQAALTSECAHTFHLRCVSGSAACPVCRLQLRPVQSLSFSASNPFSATSAPLLGCPSSLFSDDEPVEPAAAHTVREAAHDAHDGVLVLKAHCENPGVARDAAPQLRGAGARQGPRRGGRGVGARSPRPRHGTRRQRQHGGLQAGAAEAGHGFVIDNLNPYDRLSIVTFSDNARRIIRLTRMSDGGKASAKGAVVAKSLTNIGDGLLVAADVLDNRRHRNAVSAIILLSDGHDNQTKCSYEPDGRKIYRDLVPVP